MLRVRGHPSQWINRGGAPASILGDVREMGGGMPSYEHEDGGLVIFELGVVQAQGVTGQMMAFPRWYGAVCLLAPDGPAPVHHHPTQRWEWRPMVYKLNIRGGWTGLGSQEELAWRYGLDWMQRQRHRMEAGDLTYEEAVEEFEGWGMEAADNKADALLKEFLTPQQQLEVTLAQGFRVRGATTGDTYAVEIANGFARIDPVTLDTLVSYCFHPEEWLPHADVALATKLALEDEELEEEFTTCARSRPSALPPEMASRRDVIAARLEEKAGLIA